MSNKDIKISSLEKEINNCKAKLTTFRNAALRQGHQPTNAHIQARLKLQEDLARAEAALELFLGQSSGNEVMMAMSVLLGNSKGFVDTALKTPSVILLHDDATGDAQLAVMPYADYLRMTEAKDA